jgi:hypothetical protein
VAAGTHICTWPLLVTLWVHFCCPGGAGSLLHYVPGCMKENPVLCMKLNSVARHCVAGDAITKKLTLPSRLSRNDNVAARRCEQTTQRTNREHALPCGPHAGQYHAPHKQSNMHAGITSIREVLTSIPVSIKTNPEQCSRTYYYALWRYRSSSTTTHCGVIALVQLLPTVALSL